MSSWHWKVEPLFELLKLKLALVELVGFAGALLIVTVGAVVSIVHVEEADAVFPAGSVAVTVKVCAPAASDVYDAGEVHAAAAAASSLQLNVEPVFELLKPKLALIELVGFAGAAVIVTTGAVVSSVHV